MARPRNVTPPLCKELLASHGATCIFDSRYMVHGSKSYMPFVCSMHRCPYANVAGAHVGPHAPTAHPHKPDSH